MRGEVTGETEICSALFASSLLVPGVVVGDGVLPITLALEILARLDGFRLVADRFHLFPFALEFGGVLGGVAGEIRFCDEVLAVEGGRFGLGGRLGELGLGWEAAGFSLCAVAAPPAWLCGRRRCSWRGVGARSGREEARGGVRK